VAHRAPTHSYAYAENERARKYERERERERERVVNPHMCDDNREPPVERRRYLPVHRSLTC